ncbi:MAG: hypothetical protein IBX62_06340 [Coriobacteriia bacterium]|nr:hypothetical protein [Coriobacteriia bacterium]
MTAELTSIVSVLIVLSIASERLVEIVKGLFTPLGVEQTDPRMEGFRRAALQALAVLAGILTAFLARSLIPSGLLPESAGVWPVLALGLLASGGSGFWNSILGYLGQVKEVKKVEVEERAVDLRLKEEDLAGRQRSRP